MEYSVFDPYYDSFLVLDKELKVIYANEAAALLFGTSVRRLTRGKKTFLEMVEFQPELTQLAAIDEISDPTPIKEVDFVSFADKKGKGQITIQKNTHADEWVVYIRDVTLEETLQKKYRAELDQKEEVIEDLKKARAELENYSRNLEKMVEERTREIQEMHQLQTAMLNSLGQGFLVFGQDGQCFPTYSKACSEILEASPEGKSIWEMLRLPEGEVEGFKKWLVAVFEEMLPFPDLAALGPQSFPHSENRFIHLEYHPMRVDDAIKGIVLVASDQTNEMLAKQEAQKERANAEMVVAAIRNKKQLSSFIRDTRAFLNELKAGLEQPQPDLDFLFRMVHTLKGGAATFSIAEMESVAHTYENRITEVLQLPPEEQVAVVSELKSDLGVLEASFDKFIDQNKDLLGPSVLESRRYVDFAADQLLEFSLKLPSETLKQEFLDEFVMEPVGDYFRHVPEMIQKTAEDLGKAEPTVNMSGTETRILPEPYGELFSSMVHAFRNSIDHGIESPEQRCEAGKEMGGKIDIQFSQSEGRLAITVQDDGGGIPPDRIREKVAESHGADIAEQLTDHEVIQHVFDSQLSTKEEVSELSGRGVGMDAIKTAAEKLNGHVEVHSEMGKGTRLEVRVPYVKELEQSGKKAA